MIGTSFLFPGLTAVKLTALIGYKAAGILGLILALTCLNLPGLILAVLGYQVLSSNSGPITHKVMVGSTIWCFSLACSSFLFGSPECRWSVLFATCSGSYHLVFHRIGLLSALTILGVSCIYRNLLFLCKMMGAMRKILGGSIDCE